MPPSKLLDLMARKEKVKHGQNAARLRDVATSKAQVDEMDGKLTSLLEGCETSMPTQINVSRLRASHWLAGQLAQQIEVNRTKGQQLEAAMTEARTALSQSDHRHQLYQERAREAAAHEAEERAEKQRQSAPVIRKSR